MSNNTILIIGAAFFLIVAIVVGIFIFLQFKERQRTTNLKLPSIDDLDKKERIARMEENREEFGFAANGDDLKADEIGTTDDDELDPGKYIPTSKSTSVMEDFGGLLNSNGKIGTPPPAVIKSKIDLPGLEATEPIVTEETAVEDSLEDSNVGEDKVNTNKQDDDEPSKTEATAEAKEGFSLPEID